MGVVSKKDLTNPTKWKQANRREKKDRKDKINGIPKVEVERVDREVNLIWALEWIYYWIKSKKGKTNHNHSIIDTCISIPLYNIHHSSGTFN